MKQALIGLGSNQGDSPSILQGAVDALQRLPQTAVLAVSSVYQTKPWGYSAQPDFHNAILVVSTALSPHALLGACLGIEAAFHRERSFPNAPRTLDMDILLMEDTQIHTAELSIPHPRMLERAFVLAPLLELYPEGTALGLPFLAACKGMDFQGIRKREYKLASKHKGGL